MPYLIYNEMHVHLQAKQLRELYDLLYKYHRTILIENSALNYEKFLGYLAYDLVFPEMPLNITLCASGVFGITQPLHGAQSISLQEFASLMHNDALSILHSGYLETSSSILNGVRLDFSRA